MAANSKIGAKRTEKHDVLCLAVVYAGHSISNFRPRRYEDLLDRNAVADARVAFTKSLKVENQFLAILHG